MPMRTTLEILRSVSGSSRPSPGTIAPGQSPIRSRASRIWPTISSASRLRTSFCVPVWQKEQFNVQPTWLEMQSVPRRSRECRPSRFRARACRGRVSEGATATSSCRRPKSVLRRSRPVEHIGICERATHVLRHIAHIFKARQPTDVDPAPELIDAHAQLLFGNADGGERNLQRLTAQPRKRQLFIAGSGRSFQLRGNNFLHGYQSSTAARRVLEGLLNLFFPNE